MAGQPASVRGSGWADGVWRRPGLASISCRWPLLLTLGPGGMRFAFPPYDAPRVSVKGGWYQSPLPEQVPKVFADAAVAVTKPG